MLKKEGISENFGYCYIAKKKQILKASTPFITKNYPPPSKKRKKRKRKHITLKNIYIF
jgi:hypothetical protein